MAEVFRTFDEIIEQRKMYNVILADPPWQYDNQKTGGSHNSGASQKYDVIALDDLKNYKKYIRRITDNNCVIFLWATVPMLPDALDLLNAWEFRYKTMLTWKKDMCRNMGYWFRGNTEHVLVGIKGKIKAFRCQKINFVKSSVMGLKHSEKPEEMRDLIMDATKNIQNRRCIELFARKTTDGWDCLGNEIEIKVL